MNPCDHGPPRKLGGKKCDGTKKYSGVYRALYIYIIYVYTSLLVSVRSISSRAHVFAGLRVFVLVVEMFHLSHAIFA